MSVEGWAWKVGDDFDTVEIRRPGGLSPWVQVGVAGLWEIVDGYGDWQVWRIPADVAAAVLRSVERVESAALARDVAPTS